jgi:hypothetical protein
MKVYRGVVVKLQVFYIRLRLKTSNQLHASTGLSLRNSTLNSFVVATRDPLLVIGAARTFLQETRKFAFRLTLSCLIRVLLLVSFCVYIAFCFEETRRGER